MNRPEVDKKQPAIMTQRRAHDWIAFFVEVPGKWEAGRTEAEAIGHLHISHQDLLGSIQRNK